MVSVYDKIIAFGTSRRKEELSAALVFFTGVLAISFAILAFQYLIVNAIIPIDFSIEYIILNTTHPTISSAFLNNYAHSPLDPSHVANNIPAFIMISTMIFAIVYYMPKQGYQLPPKFVLINYSLFLLLLPFSISGISLWTSRIANKGWSLGLSGINFALLGLFVALFLAVTIFKALNNPSGKAAKTTFLLMASIFLVISIVSAGIFFDLKSPDVNIYAHFGGFLLGLVIPSLVGLYCTAERDRQKIVTLVVLGTSIILPALFWMFV